MLWALSNAPRKNMLEIPVPLSKLPHSPSTFDINSTILDATDKYLDSSESLEMHEASAPGTSPGGAPAAASCTSDSSSYKKRTSP